jgi:hypothetical protein
MAGVGELAPGKEWRKVGGKLNGSSCGKLTRLNTAIDELGGDV